MRTESPTAIPLFTPVLEVTAWFTSDEGEVLGPVEADGAALAEDPTEDSQFIIRLWFRLTNDTGQMLHGDAMTVSVAGQHRRVRVARIVMRPGDELRLSYDLKATFRD